MQSGLAARVQFGDFEFDLRAGELREGSRKVRLQEQPFHILRMLVERRGEIVTRDEIKNRLWPNDTIVEFDHSIQTAISKLRQALGDSADHPRYIETVARRGYRLIAKIESSSDSSSDGFLIGGDASASPASALAPQTDAATSNNLIGKKVSHYRVLEVVGGGGMGVVYRAEDLKLGRRVAMKFLPEELGGDAHALERFEREARAASAPDHANICAIHEFGEHDGQPFIVMPLLQGQNLRDLISNRAAPFSTEEILRIGIQIASGLEAAHEKGIIHRDIKPANVFVTDRGEARILDFGLAKLLEDSNEGEVAAQPEATTDAPLSSSVAAHLTRTGAAMGTAGYMSPERVRGEKLDERTDLFSLGLVLYEMATGERAFSGQTAATIYEAILNHPIVPARELNSELLPGLENAINRALEKDRNLRYQHASDIRVELQRLKRDSDSGQHVAAPAANVQMAEAWPSLSRTVAPPKTHWLLLAGAAVVLTAALVGGGMYYRSQQTKPLTDKDTIVVGDFDNKTGDAVFDDTLKTALTVALNQSPFLNVLADDRIAATLKLMTLPVNTRLTPDVARELCMRAGSKAYIGGSIANLGNEYVLGLKTANCQSGETLAQEQVAASSKEKVLNVLGDAAAKLRGKLGEAQSAVQKFDTPLEQATTSSLEALEAYSLGDRKLADSDDRAAMPFFQRAIQLDPNFAMAYAKLGLVYVVLGEHRLSMQNTRKAYELRERASERERLYIEGHYCDFFTGDLEKCRQVYELATQMYPQDFVARHNLGWVLSHLGQYDRAVSETREALRLDPVAATYVNLVDDYVSMNRLDEASAVIREAQAKQLDSSYLHLYSYQIAFLNNDAAGMQKEVAWAAGEPRIERWMLAFESGTNAFFGRLETSRDFSRRAVESAERSDEKEVAAMYEAYGALWEVMFGNARESRQRAESALAISTGRDVQYPAALTLAFAGDTVRAKTLADDLGKRFPEDTWVQFIFLPSIKAKLALSRKGGEGP